MASKILNLWEDEIPCLRAFEAAGHRAKLGVDGTADAFAFNLEPFDEYAGHNGFECVNCGAVVCTHCYKAGWDDIFGGIKPCPHKAA